MSRQYNPVISAYNSVVVNNKAESEINKPTSLLSRTVKKEDTDNSNIPFNSVNNFISVLRDYRNEINDNI
tara:strand:+ start:543 stop:752 length:210 start_codon:yes stop_codon:yes gene_type:complete